MAAIIKYGFRRSSFCGSGSCVEVAPLENGRVALRDSKNPVAPAHVFTHQEWADFVRGVRAGEFDFPAPQAAGSGTGAETTVRLTL